MDQQNNTTKDIRDPRLGQIRILHIIGAMRPGGMENFLMNLYRQIDRDRFRFDFAVHARDDSDYGEQIRDLGGEIFTLPRFSSHPFANLRRITELVRERGYHFVVRHTANALVTPQLMAARRGGALTVCHAHSETDPQKAAHYMGRLLMEQAADFRMACSEGAGKWMYGSRDYILVKNAIDIDAFRYRKEAEAGIRREYGIEQAHVFGHIGNFLACKNHSYLLDVFKRIREQDKKAVLLCLGDGGLRPQIEQQIRQEGLCDSVILAGIRKDAAACMAAMDVLLFPSIFEGLPLTLIEAQAASLPALVSDNITSEVAVTEGLVHFASIQEAPEIWAEQAIALCEEAGQKEKDKLRTGQREAIASHGYDIVRLAGWYEDFFEHENRVSS